MIYTIGPADLLSAAKELEDRYYAAYWQKDIPEEKMDWSLLRRAKALRDKAVQLAEAALTNLEPFPPPED